MVNNSFKQGLLLVIMRTATVSPLLKYDTLDKDLLKNYRPVSNIAFVGKVLENVAVRCLLDHITLNGLHEEHESVYKMLHSTETALLRVQHDISSELDKNRAMLFVMLDLSSAFDMIDHEHLLTLLHDEYGVHERRYHGSGRTWKTAPTVSRKKTPDRLKNTRDYSATECCATGLGPWASCVHLIHHPNAADIQKTWHKIP